MCAKHCDYPSKKKYKSVLYPSTVIPLSIRNFSIWNMHTILISSSRRHFLGLMSRGRTSISFILNKTKKRKQKTKKLGYGLLAWMLLFCQLIGYIIIMSNNWFCCYPANQLVMFLSCQLIGYVVILPITWLGSYLAN